MKTLQKYSTLLVLALLCITGCATRQSVAPHPSAQLQHGGVRVRATAHDVTLSWTASVVQTGHPAIAGYNVYSSTTSGGPYTKKNSSVVAAVNYMDTAVSAGQTLFYVITAVDTNGAESPFSTQVSATIPGATATLAITTTALPAIQVSVADSFQIAATGGTAPYTWTATGSSSQKINSSGVISGTPTGAGTVSEVITVTDAAAAKATLSFQWTINPAGNTTVAVSISPLTPSVVAGATLQMSASVTGSTNTAVTWKTTGGTISSTGLFTDAKAGSVTVTATSVADPTKSASTVVKITGSTPSYVCTVASTTASGEVLTVTISNFTKGQSVNVSCPVTHP